MQPTKHPTKPPTKHPTEGTKTRWGILGVAKIALEKVIPAIQAGPTGQVVAIASRSIDKAQAAAARFAIPRAYGCYEELLADPEVDAIYNPLPNHLHVPWSIRALEAGKHVLCEKPIARDAVEASQLVAARERTGRLVQEAAMVRTHPRWLGARALVRAGRIGELRSMAGFFSYFNGSPANVRHQPNMGGGGLLDIGFYPITMSRFMFESEPVRVMGLLEIDPRFGVDRLASAILEFPRGHAISPAPPSSRRTRIWTSWARAVASASRSHGACPTSDRAVSWSMMVRVRPGKRRRRSGSLRVTSGACTAIASAKPSLRASPHPCPSRTQWPTCASLMRFFGRLNQGVGKGPRLGPVSSRVRAAGDG